MLPQSDPTEPVKKVVRVADLAADAPGLFKKLDEQSPVFSTYAPDDSPYSFTKMSDKLTGADGDLGSLSMATTAFGSSRLGDFRSPESSMDLSYAVGCFRPEPGDDLERTNSKVLLVPASDDAPWIEAKAPPGLPAPGLSPTLSPGSEKHSLGTCDPCVWYWKPEGCTRGNECGYCHLCPEGEIKKRKKQKKDSIRRSKEAAEAEVATLDSALPQSIETSPDMPIRSISDKVPYSPGPVVKTPPPGSPESPSFLGGLVDLVEVGGGGAKAPSWSEGSAFHSTGQCEPCAWFWGKGCMRGKDCLRCHLCPEGELKKRKKAKVATLRKDTSAKGDAFYASEEPAKIALPPGLEAPPGLPSPTSPTLPQVEVAKVEVATRERGLYGKGDYGALRVNSSEWLNQAAQDDDDDFQVVDREPQMSEGAKYHGSGNCRPCAWFWRPMGCKNGEACCHCHLCPAGELKARKKMKVLTIRQEKQQRKTEDQDEEGGEVVPMMGPMFPMPMLPGAIPHMTALSMQPGVVSADLASAGSLDHPYNCKPCAWFHKPKGCENGKDCRHCHLCPEREIQNRRKLKQVILRQTKGIPEEHMMMPMPGAMEMQMQMAQWQEMQWRQMQQDVSGDDSPWESFSPVSWGMSPMMVPMDGEDVSGVVGDESFEAARSPKVALDLSTSLAQQ
jgi:hypothetical protein